MPLPPFYQTLFATLTFNAKVWDLRIGQRNVIPAWVGASNHELSLNERAGWVNMRSGHAPTTTEMLRLFTSLSGIFIRGGYYDGHEETWIDNVVMKEGDHKADALLRQVEKHARHPSERVVEAPPPVEEASTPKYSGVLRSKAAIAAHMAREAAFQAAKQAHEEEQARIAEEERQAVLKQEAEAAARMAAQQEAGAKISESLSGAFFVSFIDLSSSPHLLFLAQQNVRQKK